MIIQRRKTRRRLWGIEQLESRLPLASFTGLSISSDYGGHAQQGSEVRLEASVADPNGLEFSFRLRGTDSEWETASPYSSDLEWIWETDGRSLDRYHLTVFAREIGSTAKFQAAATPIAIIVSSTPARVDVSVDALQGTVVVGGGTFGFELATDPEPEDYEFAFQWRKADGNWQLGRGYQASSLWNWSTVGLETGSYFVQGMARSRGSKANFESIARPILVQLKPPLVLQEARITASATRVLQGTPLGFQISVLHDNGELEYMFRWRSSHGEWMAGRQYSTQRDWSLTTDELEPGQYFVGAFVRRIGNKQDYEAVITPVAVIVSSTPPVDAVQLLRNTNDRVVPGTEITWTATTADSNGVEYAFLLRAQGGDWQTVRAYAAEASYLWDTGTAGVGVYFVTVMARKIGSGVPFEAAATPQTIVVSSVPAADSVALVLNGPNRVVPGDVVRWTANGSGPVIMEYAYIIRRKNGDWLLGRDYSASPIFDIDTSDLDVDIYFVTVKARSIGSPLPFEVIATPQRIVVADVAAATGVTFAMDRTVPPRIGVPYEIAAWGLGGSGDYEYRFRFRGQTDWITKKSYSPDNLWQWVPNEEDLGRQFIEVSVRSIGSPEDYEAIRVVAVEVRENIDQLWQRVYADYVADDLWLDNYVEDASHTLQLPLAGAFAKPDRTEWRQAFADQFQRFLDSGDSINVQLYRLEYYYLASRFLRLAAETEESDLIPTVLYARLLDEISRLWTVEPAWMWDSPSFSGGIRQRIEWKLTVQNPPFRYYAALVDHDMFLFGIAAELKAYLRITGGEESPVLNDILLMVRRVTEERIEWLDHGGWVYQRGLWSDHPENSRAGHPFVAPNLPPLLVPNLTRDSSHSMRWPLWLSSFQAAATPGSNEYRYYDYLRLGLNRQFVDKVLVHPTVEFDGYRLRNYMDGYNGIYRYQYYTAGAGRGTNPYGLSGALMFGQWAFLQSTEVNTAYREIASQFPLSDAVLPTYIGANTNRVRHAFETWPAAFTNGNFEFLMLLAADLPVTLAQPQ